MDKPFFSVIIPTHLREKQLEALLESLQAQNLPLNEFEVILAPSPGDNILKNKLRDNFQLNISIVTPKEEKNYAQNVSRKRNLAAFKAKADWLAFTDDDCICDPNWLSETKLFIEKNNPLAIEGQTLIPDEIKKTLTYKGLKRLENPGGFQTCNIFYKKDLFLKVGGFDEVNFPWYLEDSDFAWSVLDLKTSIPLSNKSIIYHPNKEPAPWRLLHEARGAEKKVTLFLKHKDIFYQKKMKIMRLNYYLYLGIYLILLIGIFKVNIFLILIALLLFLNILTLHMLKLFRGCHAKPNEILKTAFYTSLVPPVTFFYLLKGIIFKRPSLKESLYLLSF